MPVRIGTGVSTESDPRLAAIESAAAAREGLGGERADLAVVFCCGGHLAAPESTLEGVHEALLPEQLVGCGAGGVLAGGQEVEDGNAVAVWAASFGNGTAETFHATAEPVEGGVAVEGLPDFSGASAAILLPDPYSFPTDRVLAELHERAAGVPALGGVSSSRTLDGSSALFFGDRVVADGAVGVRLEGVDVMPCVSQGAAPLGPELTITSAEGHMIRELAGAPALAKVREVVEGLPVQQRELVGEGLLVGIVIDSGKPDYAQGDFLVRGLLGADPEAGALAVGASVEEGQVIRLHARDAESADLDLRQALTLRREALGGAAPAGALCFTCNGRGVGMFGTPDHDAAAVDRELGGAPAAGFFAAGEIGPVGGESFLHGFTATVAIFPP